MNGYVVDSSVAVQWFFREHLSDQAVKLQGLGVPLLAPDFLDLELAAVVWKKKRRDNLPHSDAEFVIDQLPLSEITYHPTSPLIPIAFDLADRTNRTVYDCLYLALALQLDAVMITADDKLVNSLSGTLWAHKIMSLGQLP